MMRIKDNTLRLFKLLDGIVNQKSYVIKGQSITVHISLQNIVSSLDIPSHFRYSDIKFRILNPLIKHINETSDLTFEIVEERRTNRVVDHLVIGITSANSSPSEILTTTTQFIRNRTSAN